MSWMGALLAFAFALALIGVGVVIGTVIERDRRGARPNDQGSIGCGVILFVVGLTAIGAVLL